MTWVLKVFFLTPFNLKWSPIVSSGSYTNFIQFKIIRGKKKTSPNHHFFLQFFGVFIDQQLQLWDESNNPADTPRRPIVEVSRPSIHILDGRYYWISSENDIFLLNGGESFACKLPEDEINELPVQVVYVGHDETTFIVDEHKAFEIIVKIIRCMNLMQTSKIYSFPLGLYFLYTRNILKEIPA